MSLGCSPGRRSGRHPLTGAYLDDDGVALFDDGSRGVHRYGCDGVIGTLMAVRGQRSTRQHSILEGRGAGRPR